MELNPLEIIRDSVALAHSAGKFVVSRLVGGAFAELADRLYSDEQYNATLEHLDSVAGSE